MTLLLIAGPALACNGEALHDNEGLIRDPVGSRLTATAEAGEDEWATVQATLMIGATQTVEAQQTQTIEQQGKCRQSDSDACINAGFSGGHLTSNGSCTCDE